jgi:ribosomal protein L22
MVRKMDPFEAVELLSFTNKAAAMPMAKAIKTAIANAGKKEGLSFLKLEVNEGTVLRRNRVGTAGRGRSRPYKKKWSHVRIVLTDDIKRASVEKTKDMKGDKKLTGE